MGLEFTLLTNNFWSSFSDFSTLSYKIVGWCLYDGNFELKIVKNDFTESRINLDTFDF